MIRTLALKTFFRYIFVGGSLFIVDLTAFLIATSYYSITPAISQLISRSLGATIGFIAHKNITFKKRNNKQKHSVVSQGSGYILLSVFTFFISPIVLLQFLSWVHEFLSSEQGQQIMTIFSKSALIEVTSAQGQKITAKICTEFFLVLITFFSMKYIFKQQRRKQSA